MGCGMSIYGVADHLGFQPIRRKLEDLHKNDRGIVTIDDTPSTELLLKYGKDHAISYSNNSRKSVSSLREESMKGPALEHKESLKIEDFDHSAIKKNGSEEKVNDIRGNNENVVAPERGDNKDNKEEKEEENDYNEEERMSDYDGSALWIGSPSFREYCTNDCESEDSFKDGE